MSERRPLPRATLRARRAGALAALALCAWLAAGAPAATAPPPKTSPSTRAHAAPARRRVAAKPAAGSKLTPKQQAADARALEELGAYGEAAQRLRVLRGQVPLDGDLELAIALDDARVGQLDSAAARLWGPALTKALADSMPVGRRVRYPWQRDAMWIDGRYTGWPWYIARARAEVAAAQGRWSEALEAARIAAADYPLCGREWLVLSICASHAGQAAEADDAARRAVYLDPGLPEAHYLEGLHAWKAGRRAEAHEEFRAAVALDSLWQQPALALVRSQLPGAAPDTVPAEFLSGPRRVGLLISPVRPKPEEFVQMDLPASVMQQRLVPFPDSLESRMKPVKLYLNVLVDDRGRPVLTDLPWFSPDQLPTEALHLTLASVPTWIFRPGVRLGRPYPVWTTLQVTYDPQNPARTR